MKYIIFNKSTPRDITSRERIPISINELINAERNAIDCGEERRRLRIRHICDSDETRHTRRTAVRKG